MFQKQLHLEWHPTRFEINSAATSKTKCKPALLSNGHSINIPPGDSQGLTICGSAGETGI